jgi:hypothetical protein
MFGLTKSTKVLKERIEEVESFFEGTWMDGLGFLYLDHTGEQQNITINFDAALDRQGKPPFNISFNGENIVSSQRSQFQPLTRAHKISAVPSNDIATIRILFWSCKSRKDCSHR